MTLKSQDFEIVAGDAKVLFFVITDANGDPLALTGDTLRWALGKDPLDAAAVIAKTTPTEITIGGYDDNEVTVILDSDDTRNLRGKYYHELELAQAGGVSTLATGIGTFHPELIRT